MLEIFLLALNAIASIAFHRYWSDAREEIKESIKYMRIYYYNILWELSPYTKKELEFSSLIKQEPSLLHIIRDYPIALKFQKSLRGWYLIVQTVAITIIGVTITVVSQLYSGLFGEVTRLALGLRSGSLIILAYLAIILFRITSAKNQATDFKDNYETDWIL